MSSSSAVHVRSRGHAGLSVFLGKIAYAAAYALVLPLLLAAWAVRLDGLITLPECGTAGGGALLAAAGLGLMIWATVDLRVRGGGWPMSPYPPLQRVSTGPYAIIADPIYAGAVALCAGASIYFRVAAGLWIVTPVLALACFAFVVGYERDATRRRFGRRTEPPLLRLPTASDVAPVLADRLSAYLLVLLPWLMAFNAVNALGAPHDVSSGWMPIDASVPMWPWTELVYLLAYPMVLIVPLVARTKRQLRNFFVNGWVATAIVTAFYLLDPVLVTPKAAPDGAFAVLMSWERRFDAPLAAFPAFHVIWPMLAAAAYARIWPRLKVLWWMLAAAIAVSTMTTGMHAAADVIAGAVAGAIVLGNARLWRLAVSAAEWVANSWAERDFGRVRAMSHGLYAAVGGGIGLAIVFALTGSQAVIPATITGIFAIAGAGAWAQWIEGSPQLLRPFGYYGGLIGVCAGVAAAPLFGFSGWTLLAAYAIGGSVVQAFGRMRCLIQGCCHGRPADDACGIRFRHARSRVVRLAGLAGVPLYPTQLYAIVFNLSTASILFRMWMAGASVQLIAGAYFIANGLERFVEEHYRGEPQTRVVAGFRLYQWLALASVVAGALITCAGATPALAPVALGGSAIAISVAFTALAYVAYGVDFPRLNCRFARLT